MSKNKNPQSTVILRFKRLDPQAALPEYATPGAAGMDVRSSVEVGLGTGTWAAVGTGLSVEIPPGFEIQVRPRSGLAAKFGVTVLNAPGTIDSDYRGEIKVILINLGPAPFLINKGDRIAQLVVARVPSVSIEDVDRLSETARGTGGLGSTGVA
jgi:dUTP pyrophosphatase